MSDRLTLLEELHVPDIRNSYFVKIDSLTGQQKEIILEDHYASIERYHLHDSVSEDIATQFDVARNLYVYAWFEYRFYNVAEANVLTVLELALKERVGKAPLKAYIKKRKASHLAATGKKINLHHGMKTLMEYCSDHQLVSNEGFSAWHHHATQQAYYQKKTEQRNWAIDEMERTGKTEIELPDINIEPLEPDPNYDHVQHLVDNVNKIRNTYAHGSSMLHNDVLYSFEMVSEFINQLFLEENLEEEIVL